MTSDFGYLLFAQLVNDIPLLFINFQDSQSQIQKQANSFFKKSGGVFVGTNTLLKDPNFRFSFSLESVLGAVKFIKLFLISHHLVLKLSLYSGMHFPQHFGYRVFQRGVDNFFPGQSLLAHHSIADFLFVV